MQPRELCAILVMADAKDSKELYSDIFQGFYEYSERLKIHELPKSPVAGLEVPILRAVGPYPTQWTSMYVLVGGGWLNKPL
jgi:hypothetical protein